MSRVTLAAGAAERRGGGRLRSRRRREALRLIADALRGRVGDVNRGPLRRAIVLLAVPMVLEMCMESVFAVADIFFVSRLGAAAMAAVGLTEALLTLVYTVAMGLSIGVAALVARRIGEGDDAGAGHAAAQGLLLGAALSAVIGVLGVWQAPTLLRALGAGDAVLETGLGYARIMLGGNIVILLLFLLNAAFRGAGDAAIAMRVLWFANGLNIVLDPLLIFGIGPFPQLGVTGAAVATTIGRGTAVAIQLLVLLRADARLRIAMTQLRPQLAMMGRVLRLSGTGTLQAFIGTASWIALVRIVAQFGAEAVAGYTIAIRIVLFALLPAWGLANAAATLVGQGLGAGNPERAARAVWLAGRLNLYFLGTVAFVFILGAGQIVDLFGGDAITRGYAVQCLRIVSTGFFFYAYGMVLTQSFNGAGAVWTPTLLNLACFWFWEIPLAWLLSSRVLPGPQGVYLAIVVAFSTQAVLATWLFRREHWKLVRV